MDSEILSTSRCSKLNADRKRLKNISDYGKFEHLWMKQLKHERLTFRCCALKSNNPILLWCVPIDWLQ